MEIVLFIIGGSAAWWLGRRSGYEVGVIASINEVQKTMSAFVGDMPPELRFPYKAFEREWAQKELERMKKMDKV